MPYPTIKKVISVSKIIEKPDKPNISIIDADENMYSFFKSDYQSDAPSNAYGSFASLGVKVGDAIGIEYRVNQKGYSNIEDFYIPEAGNAQAIEKPPFKSGGEIQKADEDKQIIIARQLVVKACASLGLRFDDAKEERRKMMNYIFNGESDVIKDLEDAL